MSTTRLRYLPAALLLAAAALTACGSSSDVGEPTAPAREVVPATKPLVSTCAVSPDQVERRAAAGRSLTCSPGSPTPRRSESPCHMSADAAERFALRRGIDPCAS